jgi:hypothetical protein
LKPSNLFIKSLALAQIEPGSLIMLKSGYGSHQSIGQHVLLCQADILA